MVQGFPGPFPTPLSFFNSTKRKRDTTLQKLAKKKLSVKHKKWFIYVLKSPLTGRIRYVGMTCCPELRFTYHLEEKCRTPKCRWISGLLARGREPVFEVLEEFTSKVKCEQREAYLIKAWSREKNLLNVMDNPLYGKYTPAGKRLLRKGKQKSKKRKQKTEAYTKGDHNRLNAEMDLYIRMDNT